MVFALSINPSGRGLIAPSGSRSRHDPPELFFENCPDGVAPVLVVTEISGRFIEISSISLLEQIYPSQMRYPMANASRSRGVIERSPIIHPFRVKIILDSVQTSTVVSRISSPCALITWYSFVIPRVVLSASVISGHLQEKKESINSGLCENTGS